MQVASQLPLTQQSGVRAASVQTKAVSTYSAPGTVTSSVLPVGPPIQLASSSKQLSPEWQRLRLENAYQIKIEAPSLEALEAPEQPAASQQLAAATDLDLDAVLKEVADLQLFGDDFTATVEKFNDVVVSSYL